MSWTTEPQIDLDEKRAPRVQPLPNLHLVTQTRALRWCLELPVRISRVSNYLRTLYRWLHRKYLLFSPRCLFYFSAFEAFHVEILIVATKLFLPLALTFRGKTGFFQNRNSSGIFQDSSITWKFGTSWAEQRVWMIQIILPRILFPNSSFVLPLLPFKMTKNLGPSWGFLVAQTLHPSSLRRVFGACSWGWVSLPSHQRAPGPGQGVAFAPAWPLGRFLGTFAWRKMGQSQALTSPAKPPLEITGRDFWGSLEGWMSSPHSSFHLFH